MRNSIAAIALIWRELEGQTVWLARWNSARSAFSFVVGHKQAGETFRECLIREVREALGLEPGADFFVADQPHSHLEYIDWSEGARAETAYTMELYRVELTGDFACDKIAGDDNNRWLFPEEVQAAATQDGQPVSATMNLLLEMAGLLGGNDADPPDSPE